MTLNDLLSLYEDSPAFIGLQERTRRQYSYMLRRMSDKIGGNIVVSELTVPTCEGICAAVAVNNGAPMAAALKRCSSALFAWAVRQGYTDTNPWTNARVAGVKPREVVWNLDDMVTMYNIGMSHDYDDWRIPQTCAIVYLSYATAQRISDIKELSQSDINWHTQRLYFVQHKTGTRVSIPLIPQASALLAHYYPAKWEGKMFAPMNDIELSKSFAKVRKSLGLPREYCARDARRTRVVELIDAGCTEHEIMSWTGHKNSASLIPYAAIHGREQTRAADAVLDKLAKGA